MKIIHGSDQSQKIDSKLQQKKAKKINTHNLMGNYRAILL